MDRKYYTPKGFWNNFNPETHIFNHCNFLSLLEEIRNEGGIAKFIEKCTDKEKVEFCKKNRYFLGDCEKVLIKDKKI